MPGDRLPFAPFMLFSLADDGTITQGGALSVAVGRFGAGGLTSLGGTIKRRPDDKPMLVLVSSLEEAQRLGVWNVRARALAETVWPGPLTLLVKADAARLPWLAGATGKIGVRVSGHPYCRALTSVSGRALLSTSANRSGEAYDGDPVRLRALFTDEVDLFINAGLLPPSPPSTVVDASGEIPVLVREGALPVSALAGHIA